MAAWANQVLEIMGERLRIIPAAHRTNVSIEEKSVTIDALLTRTNAGTLDAGEKLPVGHVAWRRAPLDCAHARREVPAEPASLPKNRSCELLERA